MAENTVKNLNTGNEFISIPNISTANAGIERVGFMHRAFRSCIEIHGGGHCPLLKPTVQVDGEELFEGHTDAELVSYWIPRFTVSSPRITAQAVIFAPLERRGFACVLTLENNSGEDIPVRAGWAGCWTSSHHTACVSKLMGGVKCASMRSWCAGSPVIEFRGQTPLFAMALLPHDNVPARIWKPNGEAEIYSVGAGFAIPPHQEVSEEEISANAGSPLNYELVDEYVLKPSERLNIPIYVGIGLEEVSASASARELRLQGWDRMFAALNTWLDQHTIECEDKYFKRLMNVNSFYNYFYSQGLALDSESLFVTTSRSSRNEYCAAYMDRDAMRWSLPAVLQVSWAQARKMLIHAFTVQLQNVGARTRFIDGIVFEPGMQLDQLCAPIRALTIYVELTGDMSILFDRRVQVGVNTIQQILAAQRHPEVVLFETLLLPSGEPSRLPYVCFSNILVWRVLLDIGWLYDHIRDIDRSEEATKLAVQVREAILEHFVVDGPNGRMYARSIDLQGNFEFGDDPAGSLQLMTYLGFCSPGDPVYANTVDWIHSEANPAAVRDKPFTGLSIANAAGPSVLSVVNDLLTGRQDEALDFLRRAALDDGIACETVDCHTGAAVTGMAFASCAGYLAFGLRRALNAIIPDTAVVQQKRRPSETLYQPPPETNLDTKKARM
ncbi:MAG: glycoside hydrolase family 125 protein [Armatimonadetes bacterium]|nr:glycoside hydrolase family 125 protein [Armatimonadota bacterium]